MSRCQNQYAPGKSHSNLCGWQLVLLTTNGHRNSHAGGFFHGGDLRQWKRREDCGSGRSEHARPGCHEIGPAN